MKKTFFTLLLLSTVCMFSHAQLRVLSNGNTQIGDWTSSGILSTTTDTTSTLSILGPSDIHSGGSIAFGDYGDVMIRQSEVAFGSYRLGKAYPKMILNGKGGIEYTLISGSVFSFNPKKSTFTNPDGETEVTWGTFNFNVPLNAPGYITYSDARLKKNIESIESFGNGLMNLTPVKYNLSISAKTENDGTAEKIKSISSSQDEIYSKLSYGFIAQEVQKIYPDLVYEDSLGMLSLDYIGFIPLLVDQIQTLNAKVAQQEELIYSLTSSAKKTRSTADVEELYGDDKIVLMQNKPNPFKSSTEIRCHLPQEVSEAFICIYDLNGRQQMRLAIRERGEISVTVSGNSLQPGMYIYSLIADGKEVDSKRMILTE